MPTQSVTTDHSEATPKTYTTQQVALILHNHPETIRDACREGRIHAVHVGRCWRVSQEELQRIVQFGVCSSAAATKRKPSKAIKHPLAAQSNVPAAPAETFILSPSLRRVGLNQNKTRKEKHQMQTRTVLQQTIDALRQATVPAHRGDRSPNEVVKLDEPTSGWDSYIHELKLVRPLDAPDGTPVKLHCKDAQGKVTTVPGVFLFSEENFAYVHAFGVAASEVTIVSVAVQDELVKTALVDHLKKMLNPEGIPNLELLEQVVTSPTAAFSDMERENASEPVTVEELSSLRETCSVEPACGVDPAKAMKQFKLDCLQPDPLPGTVCTVVLPKCYTVSPAAIKAFREHLPASYDEVGEMLARTADKPVQFVLTAPETASDECAARTIEAFRKQQKTVLAVGRSSRNVNRVAGKCEARNSSNSTAAVRMDTLDDDENPCPLAWEQCRANHTKLDARLKSLEKQIFELHHRSPSAERVPDEPDTLRALTAEREKLIEQLHAASSEIIQSAPVVFANVPSALLSPAILGRTFDVVIILEAHLLSPPELIALVGLATHAVRIVGDHRHYAKGHAGRGTPEHEFLDKDVFEFCGVTRNVDTGVFASRISFLRVRHNADPSITEVLSKVAYGGILVADKANACEVVSEERSLLGVELYDISSLQTTAIEFDGEDSRFNPGSAVLSMIALSCPLPQNDEDERKRVIVTPYPKQQALLEAAVSDSGPNATVTTLERPLIDRAYFAVLDLVDASGMESPGLKLRGSVQDRALRWLTTAFSSGRKKLAVLVDLPFMEETLPQHAALRCFFDEVKRVSGPAKPFPVDLLRPSATLEEAGCSVFIEEGEAWGAVHRDVAAARSRAIWYWPRSISEVFTGTDEDRLLIRGDGLDQLVVGDVDVAAVRTLARRGVRVMAPRLSRATCHFDPHAGGLVHEVLRSPAEGEHCWTIDPRLFEQPAVLIDRNLVWLIGSEPGQPAYRIKGTNSVRLLLEYLGLDYLHAESRPNVQRAAA